MAERPLTASQLADALECFWNAAIGSERFRDSTPVGSVADGLMAVAARLREIADENMKEGEES